MKQFKYCIEQGVGDDRTTCELYHEIKFTQEEFIRKYNFVVDKLQSNKKVFDKISVEEVADMMCVLFQFQKNEPVQKIHCYESTMKKVELESEKVFTYEDFVIISWND